MSAPTASACTVVLNQQRELAIQHREQCDKALVAPCKAVLHNRTIVENGRVVVKSMQSPTEASTEL